METHGDDHGSETQQIVAGALRDNIADIQDFQAIEDLLPPIMVEGVSETEMSTGNISESVDPRNQRVFWRFTWNNYTENAVEMLETKFRTICKKYVFQKEVGEKKGTPHIQGTIQLKKKMRWSEFGLPKQITWLRCDFPAQSFDYCRKDQTRDGDVIWEWPSKTPTVVGRQLKIISELRPWQTTIAEECKTEPDDRKINWIYDPKGNCGKTVFTKYMLHHYNALANTGGCVKDVACMIARAIENKFKINEITTFIFNLTRATNSINYTAMESIKDGLLSSNKYESSTLIFNPPHMWIFSNTLPNRKELSEDKWAIWTVNESQELVPYIDERINNDLEYKKFIGEDFEVFELDL